MAPSPPPLTSWPPPRRCPFCRESIADEAIKCPHCREYLDADARRQAQSASSPLTNRGPSLIGWLLILGIFGFLTLIVFAGSLRRREDTTAAKFVPDAEVQRQRLEFIDKLQANSVFTKTEMPGDVARAWVGANFNTLSYDDKKSFCSVVFAYYYPNPDDHRLNRHLRLIDWRTGKTVGGFNPSIGLRLD